MKPSLGAVVRARRLELGLTQEALALKIGDGANQSDVSRMERDRIGLPRRARLEAIARALDLTPGALLLHSGWAGAQHPLVKEWPDRHAAEGCPEPDGHGASDHLHILQAAPSQSALSESVLRLREATERSRAARANAAQVMTELYRLREHTYRHESFAPSAPDGGGSPVILDDTKVNSGGNYCQPEQMKKEALMISSDGHRAASIPLALDRLSVALIDVQRLRQRAEAGSEDARELTAGLRRIEARLRDLGACLVELQDAEAETA